MSEDSHRWFSSWVPLATAAGPFMTVALAFILVITTYWLVGHLTECVERNRDLTDRMLEHQKVYTAQLERLAHCPRRAKQASYAPCHRSDSATFLAILT